MTLNGAGALAMIQELETSLAALAAAARAENGRVASARAEAEALLSAARVGGESQAEARRAWILTGAQGEAEAIREAAAAEALEIRTRSEARLDSLAEELFEVVLSGEGGVACSSR